MQEKIQYCVTSDSAVIEYEEVTEYGVIQFFTGESGIKVLAEVRRISHELSVVEELLELLYENDVEPCTLFDVIEDFITGRSMIDGYN